MRLRNIKNAHDIISESKYFITNPENYKGNWNSLFKNNNEIQIEIGMGKGDFIIALALKNPNINYIGIEKYATVLVSTMKKLKDLDIPNLKIINIDANNITDYFDKEISKIYLNFSDPWPKKKHSKRRLTSPAFLESYTKIFKDNFLIEMKTDNRMLFEYSLVSLSNCSYVLDEVKLDLYKELNDDNVQTEYERKFVAKGQPIYKLKAIHKIDSQK